jgi:predicted metalloprotease
MTDVINNIDDIWKDISPETWKITKNATLVTLAHLVSTVCDADSNDEEFSEVLERLHQ